jgi:hypothetical protein
LRILSLECCPLCAFDYFLCLFLCESTGLLLLLRLRCCIKAITGDSWYDRLRGFIEHLLDIQEPLINFLQHAIRRLYQTFILGKRSHCRVQGWRRGGLADEFCERTDGGDALRHVRRELHACHLGRIGRLLHPFWRGALVDVAQEAQDARRKGLRAAAQRRRARRRSGRTPIHAAMVACPGGPPSPLTAPRWREEVLLPLPKLTHATRCPHVSQNPSRRSSAHGPASTRSKSFWHSRAVNSRAATPPLRDF